MRIIHAALLLLTPSLALGVDTYAVHEITFQAAGTYQNPYLEVSLSCTFTGPPGPAQEIISAPGFWDGGDTWRCRVAPTVAGQWSYDTVSGDAGLDLNSGSFQVVDGGAPGFIQRDGPHDWRRSDGSPFYLMGDTCWRCLNTTRYSDADFTAYIGARGGQRFNIIRGYVMSQFRSAGDDINDSGTAFSGPDTVVPAYWREIDRRIAEANAAGIAWSMVVGGDSSTYEDYFSTTARRQRYLDMLVARYAAFNIIWDGVAEGQEHSNHFTLLRELGEYLAARDPYGHPRGQHPGQPPGDSTEWAGQEWLEYISYQSDKENNSQLIADRSYGLPLVNEEFCYESSCYTAQSSSHDCDSRTTRQDAWRIAMGGAYFFGGNVGTYTGGSRPFAACALQDEGISSYAFLHDLFASLPVRDMEPANALTDGGGLVYRQPGALYLVYQDDPYTATFGLDLSGESGAWRARWYDTRSGAWSSLGSVVGGSASEEFTRPDLEAWVLVLDRAAAPAPPPPLGIRRGEAEIP